MLALPSSVAGVFSLRGRRMKNEEITLNDVLVWIIENGDKTDLMDKINKTTFPFTSKYGDRAKKQKDGSDWYGDFTGSKK